MKTKNISWKDITVSQYQELYSLKQEDFETVDEYYIELLSIIYDEPLEYFENLTIDEYKEVLKSISFLSKSPHQKISESLKINELTLSYIDLNQISIGEFIDLENLLTQGFIQNLTIILSILYRQKLPNNNPILYNDKFEDYGDWIYLRSRLFNEVKITDVLGVINEFIKFRTTIYENYDGLFEKSYGEEDETNETEEVKGLSLKEKIERKNAIETEKRTSKWGWDILLLKLAKNDPTKIEEATTMKFILALNVLSMAKEMNIEL